MKQIKKFKHKKEVFISALGVSLTCLLLSNLSQPETKKVAIRSISSTGRTVLNLDEPIETKQAALQVEEEQKKQSLELNQFKAFYVKLLKTKKCIEVQNCDYPSEDPREYELSVFKDMSEQLQHLKPLLVSNWFRLKNKTKNKVLSSMSYDNGFVKEQILDLLIELPKSDAAQQVDLVLDQVVDHYNSELIPKTFEFLNKVKDSKNEVVIAKRLSKAIKSGSPHVSQAISTEVGSFLSPTTSPILKEVLTSLPKRAPETEVLTSVISEFELKTSGG